MGGIGEERGGYRTVGETFLVRNFIVTLRHPWGGKFYKKTFEVFMRNYQYKKCREFLHSSSQPPSSNCLGGGSHQ
jgi:hypothetical protein